MASNLAGSVRVLWRPNPGPQTAFLACPVREILYGGAKGGGKTDAIGPKALKHCQTYGQWATVLILRENFPQLTEIMERMRPLCLAAGGKYNKVEKTWRFPSGARIIFGHLSNGCDPYWGQEYSLIIIDEVTRTIKTEAEYLKLLGSLRNSHGVPCSVVLTSNPGGAGHNWVKARFMNVPPLTVQKEPKSGLERVYIPASLRDNPQLPPEYRATLEQMGEAERRAFLEGDWEAFEGTVFKLDRGAHILTWKQVNERLGLPEDNRKLPGDWTRFRSMDWGYSHPFAVYWYAVDHEGRAWVYREWYGIAKDNSGRIIPNHGAKLLPTQVGEKIASIEAETGERMAASWSGPDLKQTVRADHATSGRTPEDQFRDAGVFWQYWTATPGSRLAGKLALQERLHYEQDDQGQPKELPGIVFIEEECPHAIRTLPALEYDPHQPELVDKGGEDHAFDSLSGFAKMKPWKPVKDTKTPIQRLYEKKQKGGQSWQAR